MSARQMVFRTEDTEPNALAYYTEESITAKKGLKGRFQVRPKEIIEGNKRQVLSRFQILIFFWPGANVIKNFAAVIYGFS